MKKHFYLFAFQSPNTATRYAPVTVGLPHPRVTAKTVEWAKKQVRPSGYVTVLVNVSYLGEMTDEEFNNAEN
ncbi:TPA: hypothetical protein QEM39_001066 [Pseudomonas putida]|uniref:hypothetical protein n=1 Tax=Pseudomonas TaxID=286 RepID=UPI000A086E95|nr:MULTISPECIES: hypothetical protein [Pseudomonas]MDD2152048.1 hypothetical protein [Pseudomonas putida]RAS26900.1 hypothetical protein H040_02505 [Pseudomonas sp. URMO17WK12:I7]SMF23504.1 hypothetical protein SAMN02745903_02275 [Pseudomonas sp. URMO17WK12:I5]HDS1679575.1 hypothetical protein [Pseudomonas putida]